MQSSQSNQELVREFINGHVLRHAAHGDAWNLPFAHVPALDWLRYDWVLLGLAVVITVVVATIAARRHRPVPTGIANVFEAYVLFIRDGIAVAHLGPEEGRKMTSYFCSLFLFILTLNALGLVPCCSGATGNIGVTCGLALMFLILSIGMAVYKRGVVGFLTSFVPHGAPALLLPVLVPIEVLSLLARAFALMVRLFANMLAGHIIVFAMLGIIVSYGMLVLGPSAILALPVMAVVVALYLFEVFVVVFQAYIFTLLSAIFMGLMLNPEH
ncbi:MAG: F0F1 ATP synthase subunit A [Kiritimatiellia bacterium]